MKFSCKRVGLDELVSMYAKNRGYTAGEDARSKMEKNGYAVLIKIGRELWLHSPDGVSIDDVEIGVGKAVAYYQKVA